MSSTVCPSCLRRDCKPATRSAEGPMSTPRRLWPRSIGTPIMRIFWAMKDVLLAQTRGRRTRRLRIHAINHAREGDSLGDVFCSENQSHNALQAHAEARVRYAAVAAQIQ